jgi:large subunit ribosomal protein L19
MKNQIVEFNKVQRKKNMPQLEAGDVVKIHRKIKEGEKERIQIFEGIIIAIKGKQSSSPMITVRKVSEGVGVELILPVFSNNIEKIEIVKRGKIRRSKLYYLRGVTAKKSRMKYKDLSEFISQEEKEPEAAPETPVEKNESSSEVSDSSAK